VVRLLGHGDQAKRHKDGEQLQQQQQQQQQQQTVLPYMPLAATFCWMLLLLHNSDVSAGFMLLVAERAHV